MSEESSNEIPGEILLESTETSETSTETKEAKYNSEELKALKHGWKPLEDFDGPEEQWRSAREFNDRAELFDKINRQKKDYQRLEATTKRLLEHNKKIEEATRKQVIKELKEQKVEALANEDFNRVVEIDDQIREEESKPAEVVDVEPQIVEENKEAFQEWIGDNGWYNANPELAADADAFGISFGQRNPQATMAEVLEYVDKKMAPFLKTTKVTNQSTSPVESSAKSGNKPSKRKGKFTEADLDETQRSFMHSLMKIDPEMTAEKYIDDLVKIGELK
jgi:hypothetical protein